MLLEGERGAVASYLRGLLHALGGLVFQFLNFHRQRCLLAAVVTHRSHICSLANMTASHTSYTEQKQRVFSQWVAPVPCCDWSSISCVLLSICSVAISVVVVVSSSYAVNRRSPE